MAQWLASNQPSVNQARAAFKSIRAEQSSMNCKLHCLVSSRLIQTILFQLDSLIAVCMLTTGSPPGIRCTIWRRSVNEPFKDLRSHPVSLREYYGWSLIRSNRPNRGRSLLKSHHSKVDQCPRPTTPASPNNPSEHNRKPSMELLHPDGIHAAAVIDHRQSMLLETGQPPKRSPFP